jgi:hypothetical protein
MLKLIILILGLAIGFGGGVYWGHKNPEAAAKLSAEEERRFLEAQLAITQKIQAKLDQLSSKTSGSKTPGTGFLPAGQSGAATAAEVDAVKSESEQQEAELKKRIDELK